MYMYVFPARTSWRNKSQGTHLHACVINLTTCAHNQHQAKWEGRTAKQPGEQPLSHTVLVLSLFFQSFCHYKQVKAKTL